MFSTEVSDRPSAQLLAMSHIAPFRPEMVGDWVGLLAREVTSLAVVAGQCGEAPSPRPLWKTLLESEECELSASP